MHPSEMTELRKMSPEYKAIEKHHQVTSATNMNYQPLKWMHEQAEPGAVRTRKSGLKVAPARMQQLWNAGADDEVGGSEFNGDDDSSKGFSPRHWLASQHDDAEMRETAPLPMPGKARVFREDADHDRNYEGSYVSDNSIGLEVDTMKAPVQMLALTDANNHDNLYKGAKKYVDARAAYLAKHTRQADIARPADGAKKADAKAAAKTPKGEKQLKTMEKQVETQEKAGMHALNSIDRLSSADSMAAAEKMQATGHAAYLAKHARASALEKPAAKSDTLVAGVAKTHVEDIQKKSLKITSLEGEDEAEAETEDEAEGEDAEEEEVEDEYAGVKKELDDLRAMAMDAVGNLPDSAPESVRAIARGDYAALMDYFDQVAAYTTRIPHGNAIPSPEEGAAEEKGDDKEEEAAEGEEGAAEKSKPMALKQKTKFASLRKLGEVEVVLALDEAVRSPLKKIASELNDAENDAERCNIVLQGLANARINTLEILDMPSAAEMAAKEDIENAQAAEEAKMARNEMRGIPRYTPPVDYARAVPVEEVRVLN